MILATMLALPGVALAATGTPRQTSVLFGDRMREPGRRRLRLLGFALLAASLATTMIDTDRARHLIAWIATIGIEAGLVALVFTMRSRSPRA